MRVIGFSKVAVNNNIIMLKTQIKESEIDFWKYNSDRDYMELVHEMRTYPPQLIVVVRMDPSLHSYKLPIKFEGCEENLDTELMFPLDNPVLTPLMCKSHTTDGIIFLWDIRL